MKFENEKCFANHIKDKGGVLWCVGGAVRDELLGINSQDKDYMITGINISDIPFEKVVGQNFPVFLVEINGKVCEIAMARKEKKSGVGHKGFEFFTDKGITVNDDLARRDLTINAIAKNVLTDKIIDPFNGCDDLKSGILRHTTEAFAEDPLRVFRVARFAARFNFYVANETKALMGQLIHELHTLPCERVWKKLEKTLEAKYPSKFFEVLKNVGALPMFFKEVNALDVPDKHDGTAFNHTMKVMDAGRSKHERFGLLVHDFGKGLTPKELHPAHHEHAKLGIKPVKSFCDRLKAPNDFKDFGVLCVTEHMRMKRAHEMRHGKFVRWTLSIKKYFTDLFKVSFLDSVCREGGSFEIEGKHFQITFSLAKKVFEIEKEVTGKTLIAEGKEPGKHFGEILFQRRVKAFKEQRNLITSACRATFNPSLPTRETMSQVG